MDSSNKPALIHRPLPVHQAGFSLVEIMIGLTIGMLATLVIMQVLSVFEAQKRSTTGTADAQTNGSIALYSIGRELQAAGYPLMPVTTNSPLKCTTLTIDGVVDNTVPNRLSPVTITDGGAAAGASDSITIRYGDAPSGGIPTQINGVGAPTANDIAVASNFGCQPDTEALVVNGTACALTDISKPASSVSAAGVVPATVNLKYMNNTAVGANFACLGEWNEIVYAVNNGNLNRDGAPLVADIVNVQAQYGISATANSNQVTQWVDATAATGWDAPAVANRNRIKAVRIAIVARNVKKELTAVTSACSSTTSAAPTGLCAWAGSVASPAPTIDLSNDPGWQNYRYRVFETIIPLRNMIWSNGAL